MKDRTNSKPSIPLSNLIYMCISLPAMCMLLNSMSKPSMKVLKGQLMYDTQGGDTCCVRHVQYKSKLI